MKKKLALLLLCTLGCATSKENEIKNENSSILSLTQSEREQLISELNRTLSLFEIEMAQLSTAQFQYKASSKKWSIAECIEHVTLAELHFQEILEAEMKKSSNPSFRKKIKIKDEKIRPKMLSKIWKAKSPEVFRPSNYFKSTEEAINAFKSQRQKTISYVENTNDDLRNHFWKHPLTGTIDLYQTLILMSAHLERHLNQIKEIKASPNFP